MIDDDSFAEIRLIFIEEADEGLDIMESGLLDLLDGKGEMDLINDIFRAAHSIKGGSATFGYGHIAEFTHLMETLLDEMREESRVVTPQGVQLLLESVDCLRAMMTAIKEEGSVDQPQIDAVMAKLELMLAAKDDSSGAAPEAIAGLPASAPAPAPVQIAAGWNVKFHPSANIMLSGNDPGRIIRELGTLGSLKAIADVSRIPSLEAMEPEECYVSWELILEGEVAKEQVVEVFDWVEDESELEFIQIGGETESETSVQLAATEHEQSAPATTAVESPVAPVSKTPAIEETPAAVASPAPAAQVAAANAPVATASVTKAKPKAKPVKKKSPRADGGSIRVDTDKIDSLLDLVGELVITQSMLNQYSKVVLENSDASEARDLQDGLVQLENNARELQEVAMKMRMLPIKTTFARFPRLVHDLSLQLEKKIDLVIVGEHTELDKTVLEKIGDPLVHLVRNALDHGIEIPADRIAAGKSETGTLTLTASHEAGNILIVITDDGRGFRKDKILEKAISKGLVEEGENLSDEKINQLIFMPGFSTVEHVSDVSGRGVGMDVVKRNIQELGGRVEVHSETGVGSTFTIRLPLTLAILDGQLVNIADETFVIPLLSIIETVVIDKARINALVGDSFVYQLRGEYIPVIEVDKLFNSHLSDSEKSSSTQDMVGKLLVVVESAGKLTGLVVDDLLDQQQIVLKSLESNFTQLEGLSGATILGDGTVSLIIDIQGLVESSISKNSETIPNKIDVA